jgi:hypothetical protein
MILKSRNKTKEREKIMATKTKTAKGGLTAEYMRELVKKGTSKADAFKKLLAKWPRFETDKAGLVSHWNMANKVLRNQIAKKAA